MKSIYVALNYTDELLEYMQSTGFEVKEITSQFECVNKNYFMIRLPDGIVTLNRECAEKLYHMLDEKLFDESETWKAKDEALSEARNDIDKLQEKLQYAEDEIEELKERR